MVYSEIRLTRGLAMALGDGTWDFYIRPRSWTAASGYSYVADRRDFGEQQRIVIEGTIEPSNTDVLINGEKHVAGMEVEVTIRTTQVVHPSDVRDISARQIRFRDDGPMESSTGSGGGVSGEGP
jgi:hypothetical protein